MKRFLKVPRREPISQGALLREIDERHYIAQQVFFRREERGWTHQNLADLAGMSAAQVQLVEAGHANPPLRALVKLAHALGCTLAELASPRPAQPASAALPAPADATRALTS